jgi:hypothetical protein
MTAPLLTEDIEGWVLSRIPEREVSLYRKMEETLWTPKVPTPVDLLQRYTEAIAHLSLLRSSLEDPFPKSSPYYMARNSYFLVPGEPALLRVHRVFSESPPVQFLFCLEIESLHALGMFPVRGKDSKVKLREWQTLFDGAAYLRS